MQKQISFLQLWMTPKTKNNNFIQFKRGPVARAKDTAFRLYTAHANTNPLINL